MVFDDISKKVLLKAQKELTIMQSGCENEWVFLKEKFDNEITNFKKRLDSKYELELIDLNRNIIGFAKKEYKNKLLFTKSEIISDVKLNSFNNLLNLKPNQRVELYTCLLDNFKLSNSNVDIKNVVCQRKDSSFFRLYLDSNVKISLDENILGFELYVETNEKYDFTYKNILGLVFDTNEEEIQRILFK